jgi:UDP-glucose 4-epimerase
MSKYCVTGGAGFIGSHLVEHLVAQGHQVVVVDNFSTGKMANIAHLSRAIDLYEADVRDLEALRPAFAGVDVVFHQAALPSVPRSVRDPVSTTEANVLGTLNVLIAARDAGVRRVVLASSSSVYGANPQLPKQEGLELQPLSPYAASKLACEAYASAFWHSYGLETVSLRYFNVFGPRQDPTSQYAAAIPIFLRRMLSGEPPVVFGDGEQTRDFTYVLNVVQANILAATAPEAPGKVFNIACGQQVSVNQLVSRLNELLRTALSPEYAPPRPGDVRHSVADVALARQVLGYEPQVSFDEGLARTVEWFLQHRADLEQKN